MEFQVKSDRDLTIDGLGAMAAGEERTFSQADADWFKTVRGVPLTQSNVPEGVQVTIVVKKES